MSTSSAKVVRWALALSYMGAAAVLVTPPAHGAPLATTPALRAAAAEPVVLATLSSGSTDWQAPLGWCAGAGRELHIGDFNRDGRDDMLCHDSNTGRKWIALARDNGRFTGTDWQAPLEWCYHPSGELHIGDFNGDDRDDMLCHDIETGRKWIAYAKGNGRFTGTDWAASLDWCHHPGAELHIGDFNRDGRDDMLCHDSNTGRKWIALARGNGRFTGTDWTASLGWCTGVGRELHIGDFNRDDRDDMLCHDIDTGYKWIAYGKGNGRFTGTDWQAPLDWCTAARRELHIGDFNRDDHDDLMCHDTNTGYKWVILSDLGN
jgi:hypothetical protein